MDIDISKTEDIINTFAEKWGVEVLKHTNSNKKISCKFKTPRTERPNYDMIEDFKTLPILRSPKIQQMFLTSKKEDNCGYQEFVGFLKNEYSSDITKGNLRGKILNLANVEGLNSKIEYIKFLAPHVRNMSNHSHHLPYKERRHLRNIKDNFFEVAYRSGAIKSFKRLRSDRFDILLEFELSGHKFHLRDETTDYISDEYITDSDEIYVTKPKGSFEYDESYKKYLKMIQNIKNNLPLYGVFG